MERVVRAARSAPACLLAVVVAVLVAAGTATASPQSAVAVLDGTPRHLAGTASWWGGTYDVGNGQHVSINVSTAYPRDDSIAERWAAFFGGLPHGPEISLVNVYVAPLAEVRELCGSRGALGCYGAQRLVFVGDPAGISTAPTSVAAHEYGHHIAANRVNPPWLALDWGTKRWATKMGICGRVASHMAFPGDEGTNYALNPGEAFAESYRVLVETSGTAVGFSWPVVDPSFRPDADALAAVRADVLDPWTGPTTTTTRLSFARGSRTLTTAISTPLDGSLHVQVQPGSDDVALLAQDGHAVVARGAWSSAGGKVADASVCGQRQVIVQVTRHSAGRRFTLRVSTP